MSDFTQTAGTLANARKLAGASSARQIRQVDIGNTINYDLFPFLTLYGGKAVLNDGNMTDVKARIKSKMATTMTPELYDFEVAATKPLLAEIEQPLQGWNRRRGCLSQAPTGATPSACGPH